MLVQLAFQIDKDPNGRITRYLNRVGALFKGGIEEESVNLCILDQSRRTESILLRRAVDERRRHIEFNSSVQRSASADRERLSNGRNDIHVNLSGESIRTDQGFLIVIW